MDGERMGSERGAGVEWAGSGRGAEGEGAGADGELKNVQNSNFTSQCCLYFVKC